MMMAGASPGFDWIVGVSGWRAEASALRISARTARGRTVRLVFRALRPEIWKVTFLPPGERPPLPTPMIAAEGAAGARAGSAGVPLSVAETKGRLIARGPELTLEIGLRPWSLCWRDRSGRSILADNSGDVDGLGRPIVPGLGFVPGKPAPQSVSGSFHLAPGERLYGLGEKFTRLDKAGQRIVSWNRDALGSTGEISHKNVPFLWSTRGFGFFLDSGARITWDLGVSSLQSWSFAAEAPAVDAYLIHGRLPSRILAVFTGLTGRAPVPPKWSFGLWLSSGGTYRDRRSLEALLDGVERNGLPAGVLHIDPWWMRWRKYCDFRWDRRSFPRPEELLRRVHGLGLRLCLWEHPYVSTESGLFDLGRERGYFVKRPDRTVYIIDYGLSLAPRPDGHIRTSGRRDSWNAPVAIIDLTNPEALAWFKDLHRPLLRMGVDVFKTDFGEDVPADAVFHDGRTGTVMHNLYPLLYNRAVFEVTAEEKADGLVWSRSGTAGSQRHPVCWSGDPAADFESLASTIRGGLSAGMSGIPFWSHDIGGYRGTPDPELYVRWAQLGLFSSHSRMHGDSPREPWIFGPKALRIVKRYAALRYRLFPYLYSAAHEASLTGLPVLRALPLAFPDDPNAAGWDFEYMFGPCFLVAPVIRARREGAGAETDRAGRRDLNSPQEKHPVYLPPGDWVDFWTGRAHAGPGVLGLRVPLERLPLFVRAGSIIPMTRPSRRIPPGWIDPLIVRVYPAATPSEYALREDEGVTRFRLEPRRSGCVLEWSGPRPRRLLVRMIPGKNRAMAVPRSRSGRVRMG